MKIEKDKLVQLRGNRFPNFDSTIDGMFLGDKPDSLGFIEFQAYKTKGFSVEYEEHKGPCFINLNMVGSVRILDKPLKKD